MINNPNRIIRPKEEPFFGQLPDPYKFLRVGRITRVDNEKGFISLVWLDGVGGKAEVPIASPFASPRAFLGGMPELGSVVVCGFSKQTQTTGKAQILHYLTDGYESSIRFFLDRGNLDEDREYVVDGDLNDTNIDTLIEEKIDHSIVRHKRRKLYPGEIHGESSTGSEMLLSEDVQIINSRLNEIELRAADQRIIANSLNNTILTGGARINNGLISRNLKADFTALRTSDGLDQAIQYQFSLLPNGKREFIITTDQQGLDFSDTESTNQSGGGAFTEIRTELKETSSGELNITEEIADSDVDAFNEPFLTQVMGTNVGNNPADRLTYGKVLRPQIFASEEDSFSSVGDEVVTGGAYRMRSIATAYELKFNHKGYLGVERNAPSFNNRTKISIDKQGHAFINLSASTTDHPLGAGRSLEFASDGSLKMVIGANKSKGESILLHTKGGVRAVYGENINRFSLDHTLLGAYKLDIRGKTEDNLAYISNINGDVSETINGNRKVEINGSYTITANGVINERVRGTKLETYVNDKTATYGGDYNINVIGKREANIGTGQFVNISGDPLFPNNNVKTTNIISGSYEQTIKSGNLKETINLGNHEETLTAGNKVTSIGIGDIQQNITTGNKSVTITTGSSSEAISVGDKTTSIETGSIEESVTAGDKKLNITTGNYTLEIGTGEITVKTVVGSVTISGSKDVEVSGLDIKHKAENSYLIESGLITTVKSPSIILGEGATQPAVLGYQLLSYLSTHTHLHPMGPTGPPIVAPTQALLSSNVKIL